MMKEYGELENDLKLVQTICKNKLRGNIYIYLRFAFVADQAS